VTNRFFRVALRLLAVACAVVPSLPLAAQTLPDDIVVRLAGSSSIGQRMTIDAVTVWAKKIGLGAVRLNSGVDPGDYEIVARGAESRRSLRVTVSGKGTEAGLEPLLRGDTDFWMAARPVQQSDIDAMRRLKIPNVPDLAQFQTPGIENVVGLDAVTIITSARNPVKQLSIAQVKAMFTGQIANWSQVGGPNLPVTLYAMDPGAGYADIFCSAVIGNPDVAKCMASLAHLNAPLFTYADDLADQVDGDPGSLSFVAFQDKRNARSIQIGTECHTALDPDGFLVKTGEYPLSRRLYIYTNPARPPSPAARAYLDFLLSVPGQNSITMTGFGTLMPSVSSDTYSANRLSTASDAQNGGRTRIRPIDQHAFEDAVGDGNRSSITFRFQSGTSNLDSRSERDLARLAEFMALPANKDMQVVLVGFSSAAGDYAANRALSADRAAAIRDRLTKQYGIKDAVAVGVGPTAPVACNLDPSTAPLNQRVEVWLRRRS